MKERIFTAKDFRAYREALGMTQGQLAEALGVPSNTVARWERDELEIRHPKILELALKALEKKL
jgi:transcriptional regulator with XRE-family HTH domain